MSDMIDKSKLKILDDQPTEEDAFGSHHNIATGLKKIIDDDKDGKSIALLGGWGTGKSTVIKILLSLYIKEEKPSETPSPTFIEYDAWSRENDLFKRSFLQNLLDKLFKDRESKNYKDLKIKIWSNKLDVEKDDKSAIHVIILAISIMTLMPFGLNFLPNKFTDIDLLSSDFIWLLLFLSPLIYMFGLWFCGHTTKQVLSSIKGETEPEVATIDQPQADFIHTFNEIISKSNLSENDKIIFVIDNLDRIEDEHDQQKIWGSLSEILTDMKISRETDLRQISYPNNIPLYFIVPVKQDLDDKAKALNLIDKLFDLIINTSNYYLIDWENYFLEKITKAIPDIDTTSLIRICAQLKMDNEFTPRKMIKLINDISLKILFCEEAGQSSKSVINPEFIAAYLLHVQNTPSEVQKNLFRHSALTNIGRNCPEDFGFGDDQDRAAKAGALYFNVTMSNAEKITLKSNILHWLKIGTVIENGDYKNTDNFDFILSNAVNQYLENKKENYLAYYINPLATIYELGKSSEFIYKDIYRLAKAIFSLVKKEGSSSGVPSAVNLKKALKIIDQYNAEAGKAFENIDIENLINFMGDFLISDRSLFGNLRRDLSNLLEKQGKDTHLIDTLFYLSQNGYNGYQKIDLWFSTDQSASYENFRALLSDTQTKVRDGDTLLSDQKLSFLGDIRVINEKREYGITFK